MAGADYCGFAFCPSLKKEYWTQAGFIQYSKGIFNFHKEVSEEDWKNFGVTEIPTTHSAQKNIKLCKVMLDGHEWYFLTGCNFYYDSGRHESATINEVTFMATYAPRRVGALLALKRTLDWKKRQK